MASGRSFSPQTQQPPRLIADAAADLQGSALTSGAAAAQVGNDRGHEDHRHQQPRHLLSEVDGGDDVVGTLPLRFGEPVQPHDGKAPHRHQVQHPRMGQTHLCGGVHADVEQGANDPAHQSDDAAQYHPFQQRHRILSDVGHPLLQPFHVPSLRFLQYLYILSVISFPAAPVNRRRCRPAKFLSS